ncbi:hypothetical protein ACFVZW_05945, partial [Streptomyces sp. NPDC059567]
MIRQRQLTLACSVVGAAVVALDGTVLTLAQPALQRDLGASFAQVQWTSTGYLVAVASLLVFPGPRRAPHGPPRGRARINKTQPTRPSYNSVSVLCVV